MKKIVLTLLGTIALYGYVAAQLNSDSLFLSAIKDTKANNYSSAIQKAETILESFPNRVDVLIFIANVHAWREEYATALNYIGRANSIDPKNSELYDTWLNILLWSGNYKQLLEVLEIAEENHYPNKYNIVLKGAMALKNMGYYSKGLSLIERNPTLQDSSQIKTLYIELYRLNKPKVLSIYYATDQFKEENQEPQHLSFVDYAIKIKKHTLIPRLSYANRYGNNDFQIEADYYHVFTKRRYLYSNMGVSINQSVFPMYSAGLEQYLPIGKATETSLGGRYLKTETDNIFIVTGNLNTYYKNLWFMVRPFWVIHKSNNTLSTVFAARRYSANPINYWGLELLYGNSPDERYAAAKPSQQFLLKSYKAKILKNTAILDYHELMLSAAYTYEEYATNSFRNRFTFEVSLKIRI
ncbi:MAG: YaiO family outer membrane beta-barrel protein [Bacteroidales bacterium]|nr:YaiO family outer membrane beta-barrel protein [Bacteroidales bacterium]MBN2750520.1 YaiO family outer membrane beta-barrel protein [Bacteroidales bacterium]